VTRADIEVALEVVPYLLADADEDIAPEGGA
jgi:hypothetical protein